MPFAVAASATERGIRERGIMLRRAAEQERIRQAEVDRLARLELQQRLLDERVAEWFAQAKDEAATADLGPQRVSAHDLLRSIARYHDVTLQDVRTHLRSRSLVAARHHASYEIRRQCGLSLPHIGRMLGGRDHTTVLHGVNAWPAKAAELGIECQPMEGRG